MTMVWRAWTVAAVLGAIVLASQAHAEKRVALVIGNSGYRHAPALTNTQNDAGDTTVSLQRLGFSVTSLSDASFDQMRRGLLASAVGMAGSEAMARGTVAANIR